ncbi:N-acetylmuramoyl-L-alanine amidase, partial [Parafrankia sp. EUN1f]
MTYPTTYPGAKQRIIPINHSDGGMVQPTRGLIPHVQMGRSSLFGWFSNPASGVSSHLWLSKAGGFEQYVEFGDKAWAEGAGNPYWISCECEGSDTEDYTPIQIARLGELFAWGIRAFGWRPQITDSPSGYGLGTHRMGGAAW